MKLNEFHVAQLRSRAKRCRESITGRRLRIRAFSIHLRAAAGCKQRSLGVAIHGAAVVFKLNPGHSIAVNDEISKECERNNRHVRRGAHAGEQRIDNDLSGESAVSVHDSREAVPSLARK